MKRILFTLFILVAFTTSANAGEMYSCIDRNGNSIVTDSPQDGMENCVLKDSYDDPSPYERAEKQWGGEIENKQQQAQIIQEETMRKENERKKAIQDARNKEADKLEEEARRMPRGTQEQNALKGCMTTNAARVRLGEQTVNCDGSAVGKATNKRQCEDDCSNEKLSCMGDCMSNMQCISRCDTALFRCLSKCN